MSEEFNRAYAAWTRAREGMILAMRNECALKDPPAHTREDDIKAIVRMYRSFDVHSARADEFVREFMKMVN